MNIVAKMNFSVGNSAYSVSQSILVDSITRQLSLWIKRREVQGREVTVPSCSKKKNRDEDQEEEAKMNCKEKQARNHIQ